MKFGIFLFSFLSLLPAFVLGQAGECSGCIPWCEAKGTQIIGGVSTQVGTYATPCLIDQCLCVCTNDESGVISDKCGFGNIPVVNLLICFSSATTASVEGRGKVSMRDIQVGDRVLTSSGNYESVYSIDHRHLTKSGNFVQIHINHQPEGPIELTPKHMVFLKGNPNPVPAHSISVGDELRTVGDNNNVGPSTVVTKIDTITRDGIFNPLTKSGTIVVNNGIVASTYSAILSDNEWIEIAGMKIMTHEKFFNMALKPYRYICTGISLELCKTSNERVAYSQLAHDLYHHLVQKQNSDTYQLVSLASIILFLFFIDFVLSPYGIILAATAIAYCWMKNKKSSAAKKTI